MDGELINNIMFFSKILLQGFIPMISYFATNKVLSTYTLHKDFKPKDISKVSIPLELKQKYTDIEISQIGSKKVREAVLEFADILEKEFPKDSLINFYNNVNEVKIKRNGGILFLSAEGTYSCEKNKIDYCTLTSIYHELFHMASAVFDNERKLGYAGFRQAYYKPGSELKGINIGVGINEGYTQLLALRYFGDKHKISKTYKFEVGIVEKLEKIVGQDEMKRLYLNANLMGLIENLKQYANEEDVLNFINGVDLVSKHSSDLFLLSNDKMKTSIINVYTFLLQAYITKLKKQVENGIITTNEFVEQSTQYIKSLGTSVKVGGHNYEFLSVDSLLDNLEKGINTQEEYFNFINNGGTWSEYAKMGAEKYEKRKSRQINADREPLEDNLNKIKRI